jgi:hypothetical protein
MPAGPGIEEGIAAMNRLGELVLALPCLAPIAAVIPLEIEAADPHTEEALPSVDLKERPPEQPPTPTPGPGAAQSQPPPSRGGHDYGGARHYAAACSYVAR